MRDVLHPSKAQSGLKRRELDSSGKACRKALAGIVERPANTRSVEKLIKPRGTRSLQPMKRWTSPIKNHKVD
ncbi:hypothetical protein [Rossellomorea sp. RS05]|uniref:hypothetical protein n=1 Tax=Rossellomorea sp. RS05 TaxID=3149166 RepID=UPI001C4956F5